ncbi:MAG: type II toxin-antitoxin system HicA family toxin [Chloroflexota bacterium]
MSQKLPRLRANEVIRVLGQHGFDLVSQRGSHQKWRNSETGKQVIVPYHKGKELPLGTLRWTPSLGQDRVNVKVGSRYPQWV